MTKDKDPRRKEITNLNRGKFFCRKIWTHLHQKESIRHTQLSKLGQNFSIEKFWMTRNKGKKDHNTQLFKLEQIFLTKNLKRRWQRLKPLNWGKFFSRKICHHTVLNKKRIQRMYSGGRSYSDDSYQHTWRETSRQKCEYFEQTSISTEHTLHILAHDLSTVKDIFEFKFFIKIFVFNFSHIFQKKRTLFLFYCMKQQSMNSTHYLQYPRQYLRYPYSQLKLSILSFPHEVVRTSRITIHETTGLIILIS